MDRKPYVPARFRDVLRHAADAAVAGGAGGDFEQSDIDRLMDAIEWLDSARTSKPLLLDLTPSELGIVWKAMSESRDDIVVETKAAGYTASERKAFLNAESKVSGLLRQVERR